MNISGYEGTAAIGYLWEDPDDDSDTTETLVASGAVEHMAGGVSVKLAVGDEDEGGSYGWIQLGWEGDLTPIGPTSFSVDYWDGSDVNVDGSSSEAITLAAVQKIDDFNLEVYAAYRTYSYDEDADSYQDGDLLFAGARWRF
ncbi:MAG: hypothetical protein AAF636_10445 [Pseudomonadota bacterium]